MEIVDLPCTLRDLSHDLRTPLTGILGNIELLNDEEIDTRLRPYITDIKLSSYQLAKVIIHLLDEAKKVSDKDMK